MIVLTAGRGNVASGSVVGEIRGQEIRAESGHADDIVERAGIMGIVVILIAGRENGDIPIQDGVVLGRLEVMDGIDLRRASRLFIGIVRRKSGGIAERAGNDGRAHVRRIFDRIGHRPGAAAGVAGENLAAHDPAAILDARTSGNTGDPLVIVVDGGNRAGTVRSVTGIALPLTAAVIIAFIPGNRTVGAEIVTVNVIHVTVFIVVDSIPRNFALIHPHVIGQVRMVVFHALVHDSYDDIGVTANQIAPDIIHVDVGTPRYIGREGLVALVVIMPLVGQHRVVEFTGSRRSGRGFRGGFRGRIDLTVRGFGGKDIVLDKGHLCQFCRLENRPIQLSILFQVHHEPAVQAKLPLQIFLSGKRLEQRFHRQDALELQFFQFRIGRPGCEFDQERGHVPLVAQVHHFRPGGTGDVHNGRQRFLPAGNQDGKQRDGHKDNSAISHHNSFIDKRPGDNAPGLICRNTNRLNVIWSSGRFL